jgi:FMN phosphatase YigB (HAD superfamily)
MTVAVAPQQTKPLVVLDAGRVLVDLNVKAFLGELSARCDREITLPLPFDLDALMLPVYLGKQSCDGLREKLSRALEITLAPDEWPALWCTILSGEVAGMREALTKLRQAFRLVALSNTDEVHWSFALKQFPIFRLLDGWVVSYEEGLAKPDPAIYQTVVERFCPGEQPFFFTDDMPHFVEAAQRLGWEAAVFRGPEKLMQDIEKRHALLEK